MGKRIAIGAGMLGAILVGALSLLVLLVPPPEPAPLDPQEFTSLVATGNTAQGFVRLLQVKRALIVTLGKNIHDWATGKPDEAAGPKRP